MKPRTAQRIARFHKILGLVIGVQLLLWTISGLYFTIFPIWKIHGDHLRTDPGQIFLETGEAGLHPIESIAAQAGANILQVRLKPFITGPAYEVDMDQTYALYDAVTGQRLSPIGEDIARQIALDRWAGEGELVSLERVANPPREARKGPAWRAEFKGKDKATFWIDEQTGDLRAIRTGEWRLFDFLWGLHIMDWTERETFTSWWMKAFAFGGVTMTLLGFALIFDRARKGRLFK